MTEQQIHELLNKYEAGRCTPEEEVLLIQLIDNLAAQPMPGFTPEDQQQFLQQMDRRIAFATDLSMLRQRRMSAFKWIAAASVLIILSVAGYFYVNIKNNTSQLAIKANTADVAPGKTGATLVLENGKQIVLDNLQNGIISNEGGAEVALQGGQLIYGNNIHIKTVTYNTLQTPKGRQFQIQLPDGTKAWLNSSSSIKYPTVFQGEKREVQLSGEVYLEVEKNVNQPFHVILENGRSIEVLGTRFNVNAYSNENEIKTTLLEGSIKLHDNNESVIVRPGQQARIKNKEKIKLTEADNEEVLAWMNGYFQFNEADLQEVLRQLVRWYDVEVEYTGELPKASFVGQIPRTATLSQVLKVLSNSGVNFTIENKTIIIQP
jgi:transmembrane sensor